ncbi:SAM-dependent methyltransferase [Dehalococcoidia bacterium]|nr:SAM-dependent methyltransferase [Dehalococcoidia bacterium]
MSNSVQFQIRDAIKRKGKITFAEFMGLALFSKQGGYYYSNKNSGQRDYFTSPLSHPVFGALISIQLKEVWDFMGKPTKFPIIELGAGSGVLSRDIVRFISKNEPKFFESIRYFSVDYQPSGDPFPGINFFKSDSHPFQDITGCIISNELLDSFPVHRFIRDGSGFKEVYVDLDGDDFVEVIDEISTSDIENRLSGYGIGEGLYGEVNLKMHDWSKSLSNILKQGLILTVDYGDIAESLYTGGRKYGTLNCYYDHMIIDNPYENIGDQDITAHVDFSALMTLGENNGFRTAGFTTQKKFLRNLGFQKFVSALSRSDIDQATMDANRYGMMELVKTGHMGDFKVLGQTKGLEDRVLSGFEDFPQESGRISQKVDPVFLSSEHLNLISGRYPHLTDQMEYLWPFDKLTE